MNEKEIRAELEKTLAKDRQNIDEILRLSHSLAVTMRFSLAQ